MKKLKSVFVGSVVLGAALVSSRVVAEPEEGKSEVAEYSPPHIDFRAHDVPENVATGNAVIATSESDGVAIVYFADGKTNNQINPLHEDYSAFDGDIFNEIREYAIELNEFGGKFDRIVLSKSKNGKDHLAVVVRGFVVYTQDSVGAGNGGLKRILREVVPEGVETARRVDETVYPEDKTSLPVKTPSVE